MICCWVFCLFITFILKLGSAVWHMWARKRCFLAENRVFWGSGGVKNEPDLLRKKVPPFLGSNVWEMGVLGEKQRVVQVVHKEGRNRHPPPVVDSGRNRDFYPVFRGFSGFLAKNGRFSGFSGVPARTPKNTKKQPENHPQTGVYISKSHPNPPTVGTIS